ncbi:hypothetical protein ECENVIRA811_1980 [Escherichia coli Envira 8/11]|nr:hypothetical protein EC2860050_5366 [Escherichia coli 2860050]EMX72689.1 hypothetical protein ECENVIRA811_1980 [Escherichia coli Envira 8/11]EMX79223.1 hypothetical protein ECENVIRA101_5405 [Escherichia coli Envira 10/1]ENC99915.1 hypothetical protein ECP030230810_1673 [Escherichia coli P0302308.10]ENH21666.1 hypothetical protein ECP030230812_1717 [Escherichia coli P0302308.12]EPH47386.1 hypothetical protein L340_4558 [Escherichia coli E2265]ESV04525.1 hypothetical protein L339_01811 [Esch
MSPFAYNGDANKITKMKVIFFIEENLYIIQEDNPEKDNATCFI